ncbi:MAG: zinc ribbon domain-containing protein [Staphylococcus lugdunensis]|nr:zinc ribbon domain-containing protein [Staphylococcus lugdunensis]
MKCKQCGTEFNHFQQHCPTCGEPIQVDTTSNQQQTSKQSQKRDIRSQFGAGAQQHKKRPDQQQEASHDSDVKEQVGASSTTDEANTHSTESQEQFSAHSGDHASHVSKNDFGASSTDSVSTGFLDVVKNIFKLDDTAAWAKRIIISIAFFVFYVFFIHITYNMIIFILNVLLFPFVMCVVDHVLSKVFKKSSYAYDIQQHGFAIATGKVTLKYIFLLFIWNFSWILGILSFIYLYSLAKKLG